MVTRQDANRRDDVGTGPSGRLLDRRVFLTGAAAALGGLGSQLVSAERLGEIGLQLYTVREPLAKDFEDTVSRVAEVGFNKVEFAGYGDLSPKQIAKLLADNGLTAPATHVLIDALEDPQGLIDDCLEMGHEYLVMAYLLPDQRRTFGQYQRHAEVLNRAGELCKASGLTLGYHNHDFEFVELAGRRPMDYLLSEISPEIMVMELDIYWITKAGANPFDYFRRWPGRFPMAHLKDMDSDGGFTEVGSGVIDFAPILAQSESTGLRHHFVEQDVIEGDPFESIAKSLRQVRSLEF